MSVNKQAARIKHHTSTTTGAFTVPASEDFTDGTWDKWDLAKSEIGVNEFDETVSIRIGANVYEIYTAASLPPSSNIGNSDLTISAAGVRKLILGGAATSDQFAVMDSTDTNKYFYVGGAGATILDGTTKVQRTHGGSVNGVFTVVSSGNNTSSAYIRNVSNNIIFEFKDTTGNAWLNMKDSSGVDVFEWRTDVKSFNAKKTGEFFITTGGALSTDAWVVRNSAFSKILSIRGNGQVEVEGNFIAYGSGAVTSNTSLGDSALNANTTGSGSTAVGVNALLSQTTSIFNTAGGTNALRHISAGSSNNTAWGYEAGRFDSSGTANSICNSSVFVGKDARPHSTGQTNQIVIGPNARGNGSNTATIGDAGVTNLYLGTTLNLYQETTGVAAATFTANTSGIADDTATFDGYTIGQVVKALRNLGILA